MSSQKEESFPFFGTPLELLDEENIPKKKAFSISDQIATDEQGRRRFHGAFTGGFSAGFFNTVGSLEGWKPSQFKSSRTEKGTARIQNPEDFMDDEDTGEFGIAPKLVRATEEYVSNVKQKRPLKRDGPIPGIPVLQTLLEPAKETIGIRLLRKMGWKPGQVVGERIIKQKNKKNDQEPVKIYGCEIPSHLRPKANSEYDSSSEEEIDSDLDDYKAPDFKPRENTQGMGYSGLNKNTLQSHINLFNDSEFRMRERNNKVISITGTAFGVGAFENEDDDIYLKDDMSKYDFAIDLLKKKQNKIQKSETKSSDMIDGFVPANKLVESIQDFPLPNLPKNFIPKHGVRLSRFEPLPEPKEVKQPSANKTRHKLSAQERSVLIETNIAPTPEKRKAPLDIFSKIIQKKIEFASPETSTQSAATFLPLDAKDATEPVKSTKMSDIVPIESNLIFDKFIPELNSDDQNTFKYYSTSVYQHGTEEMQKAAKENKFGVLTRHISEWKPNKLLCKRFNVPEPSVSLDLPKPRVREKSSILSYYEAYLQNKTIPLKKPVENSAPPNTNKDSQDAAETPAKNPDVLVNPNESSTLNESMSSKIISKSPPLSPKINTVTSSNEPTISNVLPRKSFAPPENIYVKKNLLAPDIIPKKSPVLLESVDVINTSEKLDLYKTIFLSSSESEDEEEEKERTNQKNEELKKLVIEDLPDESKKVSTSKGIFSDFDMSKVMVKPTEKPAEKPADKDESSEKAASDPNIYGPVLPVGVQIDKKDIPVKSFDVPDKYSDEWIEIGEQKHSKHKKKSKDRSKDRSTDRSKDKKKSKKHHKAKHKKKKR